MGAAVGAFNKVDRPRFPSTLKSRTPEIGCGSLKANMGHLEAGAAAAGLASLIVVPLDMAAVVANAQLRRQIFKYFLF